MREGAISARGVGRRFLVADGERSLRTLGRRRTRELWALRDVDLDIEPGETFGVIGRNGSGKSTLLKLLAQIYAPTCGTLRVSGRVGSLLDVAAGFHPEFTGVENAYLNAAIHGLPRGHIDRHLDDILAFAELEEFAHVPVRTYSSGMYLRLGFAIAIHLRPSILLVDEVLAVGDEAFQQRCFGKIWEFRQAGGTIVFVSHDAAAVESLCTNAVLLERGRAIATGPAPDVLLAYHRTLADDDLLETTAPKGAIVGPCSILSVRALDADGRESERFLEADTVTIEAVLGSETGIRSALIVVGLQDMGGRAVSAQKTDPVDLAPGRPETIRFTIPSLPLRDGRYVVEILVLNHNNTAAMAKDTSLEFSVFARDGSTSGPIRLGGVWEVPPSNAPWRRETKAAAPTGGTGA
jgi:ABC-type polysaccharide/polyol phosphate transport system ATPase subunit